VHLFWGWIKTSSNQPKKKVFADATLLPFPVARLVINFCGLPAHYVAGGIVGYGTNSWAANSNMAIAPQWAKKALASQLLASKFICKGNSTQLISGDWTIDPNAVCWNASSKSLLRQRHSGTPAAKLVILSDADCAALQEIGYKREVRIALKDEKRGIRWFLPFEAIPSETIQFFRGIVQS